MIETIKSLLGSKKTMVAAVTGAAWLLGRFGLSVDAAELEPLVNLGLALIVAIGAADFGKAAKLAGKKK